MTMWRKARPIVLAGSIALNVAFLSTWAMHAIPAHLLGEHDAEERTRTDIWCPLHRELGVTTQQWHELEPRLQEFHEKAQENCRRLQQLRDELLELLAAPEPDMGAIRTKQEKILERQGWMQGLVLDRLLEEKKVLTAEQEEKLFSLMRERMKCSGPQGIMGPGNGHAGGMGRPLRNLEEK